MNRILPRFCPVGPILALLAAACAEPALPDVGRLTHLELRRIEGQEQPRPPRSLLRVRIPEGARHWGEHVERPAILPGEGGTEVRVWKGGGQLHVPGPLDLRGVNRIEIGGRFRDDHRFELKLIDGEEVVRAEGVLRETSTWPGDPQHELSKLDLLELPDAGDRPWQELDFTLRGLDCEIFSLELVEVAPEETLPDCVDPCLLAIRGQFRRSVGLAPERGLEATIRIERGDALEFELGIPEHLRVPVDEAGLRIRIEAGEELLERELSLQEVADSSSPWTPVRVELSDLAGRSARVRFELVNRGEHRVAAALANPWVGRRGRQAPTVLLVTSDTHRADHLGAADSPIEIRTPALDALAARGVLFEDCFSTANSTVPSHAALLTGLSPRDTGVLSNEARLKASAFALGEAFHAAGFRTLSATSVRILAPDWSAVGQGFERQLVPVEQDVALAEETVTSLLEWIDESEGLPLFIWLHLFDAHAPYAPPGRFDRLYYDDDLDPYDPSLPNPAVSPNSLYQSFQGLKDLEYPRAQYRGEISYLDAQLSRLLDLPRMQGAIIAFTSDHGEVLYRKDAIFDHLLLLPATLHVPLVMAWPGAPAGVHVRAPTRQIDVGRTLLNLSGLGDVAFPGRDLRDALEPSRWSNAPRFALGDFGRHASVTRGNWYLLLQLKDLDLRGFRLERHKVELYDLVDDPTCLVDLSRSERETARELRALLLRWLSQAPSAVPAQNGTLSDDQLAQLRALGYATSEDEDLPTTSWIDPECTCERCAEFR